MFATVALTLLASAKNAPLLGTFSSRIVPLTAAKGSVPGLKFAEYSPVPFTTRRPDISPIIL